MSTKKPRDGPAEIDLEKLKKARIKNLKKAWKKAFNETYSKKKVDKHIEKILAEKKKKKRR